MVRAPSIVLLTILTAAPVRADSYVRHTLELGGDNHADNWEAGQPAYFTPGQPGDGQEFPVAQPITWDLVLEAWGTNSANGRPIYGLANIVFSLELRMGSPTGPLAESVNWFSSIHDGDGGDAQHNAAFALSYNIAGNGPGTVTDPLTHGGPFLSVHSYPVQEGARLKVMGAGYFPFLTTGEPAEISTPGVGMSLLPNGQRGAGVVPVAEGQIDTSGLSPGVYYLLVLPGMGVNVIKEEAVVEGNRSFAVRADVTLGDEIMFVLTPEPGMALLTGLGLVAGGWRRRRPANPGPSLVRGWDDLGLSGPTKPIHHPDSRSGAAGDSFRRETR